MLKTDEFSELIKEYLDGDEAAFEKLYSESVDYAFRIACTILNNSNDIEDTIQNAYISVCKNLSTLREPDRFLVWLRKIVENECKAYIKKRRVFTWSGSESSFEELLATQNDSPSVDDLTENNEIYRAINSIIDRLPPEKKMCIKLYYFEQLSIKEIAIIQGVPEGTIKTRLYKSRKKVEKLLKKQFPDDTRLMSIGIIPIIVSSIATGAKHICAPSSIASNGAAIAATASQTAIASAAGVSTVAAASTAAAVIVPKVAAVALAAGVVTGTATAVKKHNAVIPSMQTETIETTLTSRIYPDRNQSYSQIEALTDEVSLTTRQRYTRAFANGVAQSQSEPTKTTSASEYDTSPTTKLLVMAASTTAKQTAPLPTETTRNEKASTTIAETTTHHVPTTQANNGCHSSGGVIIGYDGADSAVIPSSINGEAVNSIGRQAFMNKAYVTSVTIPSTVTGIGLQAFSGCTGLNSISLPASLRTIGIGAFYGCTALNSIAVPAGTQSIGDEAFSGCSNLKSITIPSSVTHIGDDAFAQCENLTITCRENSVAHHYAMENSVNYIIV